jgi:GH43 family beta-xylosidase
LIWLGAVLQENLNYIIPFKMNQTVKTALLLNLTIYFIGFSYSANSQTLYKVGISGTTGLTTDNIVLTDSYKIALTVNRPLFTFLLNNKLYNSGENSFQISGNQFLQVYDSGLYTTLALSDSSNVGSVWRR